MQNEVSDAKTPNQPSKWNPFRWIDKFFESVIKGLFQKTPVARNRLKLIAVVLLVMVAAVYDYPNVWNKGAKALNTQLVKVPALSGISLPSLKDLPFRLGLDLLGGSHLVYEADVSNLDNSEKANGVEGARDVIERRVNAFGISEPVVQTNKVGNSYRIVVELAGIKDINQAIKQIGETPVLDFRYGGEEPGASSTPATPTLTADQQKEMDAYNKEAAMRAQTLFAQIAKNPASFETIARTVSEDPGSKDKGGDLGFFARGVMVKEFDSVVFDQLKVGQTYYKPLQTQFGYHIIKKTDYRETTGADGKKVIEVRASHILIRTKSPADYADQYSSWIKSGLTGKQLTRSAVAFDPNTGFPEISLEFNADGKKLFADLTTANVGKRIAIFLDGTPISAPTVSQPITDGSAVINGNFSLKEAKQLAQRLNAGALPVPIKLIGQQTIGPSLGQISLQKSLFAGLIGLIAVVLFMIFYYRLPGVLASIALSFYVILALAVFKLVGVTMTLAGIAGFILSVGMAVDANVLIFERLKEELRSGKPLSLAVNEGFARAWLSIRDSNMSSLITSGILAWFGTSLVKGFAITLALGIAVSMFSAITITRTFLRAVEPKIKNKWLMGGMTEKLENSK